MSTHDAGTGPQDHDGPDHDAMDELDLTDRWLSQLAADGRVDDRGRSTPINSAGTRAVAELLRNASGPAERGELAGDQLFLRAFDEQADAARERRRTPRTVTILGKVVAVKGNRIVVQPLPGDPVQERPSADEERAVEAAADEPLDIDFPQS